MQSNFAAPARETVHRAPETVSRYVAEVLSYDTQTRSGEWTSTTWRC
jgi:hypothetical protein